MRIHVVAVGRLKQGPERELADRYRTRFEDVGRRLGFRTLSVIEIPEGRARDASSRIAEEATSIRAAMPQATGLIALHEAGESINSQAFAKTLRHRRDAGQADLAFLIGGADGLSPNLLRSAEHTIAFGAVTWPHQLVRVLLFEQLYRAATLLAGHPYHRA